MAWEDWADDESALRKESARQALIQELGEDEVLRREYEETLTVNPVLECVLSVYDTDGTLLSACVCRGERWDIVSYGNKLAISLLPSNREKLSYFRIDLVHSLGRLPREEARLSVSPLES